MDKAVACCSYNGATTQSVNKIFLGNLTTLSAL